MHGPFIIAHKNYVAQFVNFCNLEAIYNIMAERGGGGGHALISEL